MADNFSNLATGLSDPYRRSATVTPNDSADLDPIPRALYIGSTGNVSLRLADDSTARTFTGVPSGTVLQVRALRVRSTNTTASDIVALW